MRFCERVGKGRVRLKLKRSGEREAGRKATRTRHCMEVGSSTSSACT